MTYSNEQIIADFHTRQKHDELFAQLREQKRLREEHSGQAKRPYTKAIRELEDQLDALVQCSTPRPTTPDKVSEMLANEIGKLKNDYIVLKGKLSKAIENDDVAYFLEWNAESMAASEWEYKHATKLEDAYQRIADELGNGAVGVMRMLEIRNNMIDRFREEAFSRLSRGMESSTSRSSNLVKNAVIVAKANYVEQNENYTGYWFNSAVEGLQVYAVLVDAGLIE